MEVCQDEIELNGIQSDEILIKTHYSIISAGTELACLSGKESSWFKFPSVPGYSSVGEIVDCGSNVSEFKIGETVFIYGTHSSYSIVNVKEAFCVKLSNGLDERYATFARIATIAMTALRISDIQLGDFVGVTGLGLVGNIAAQLAKAQGGFVIGMDMNEQRLETAKKCGIHHSVNITDSKSVEKIKDITNKTGINTLIEATGVPVAVPNSIPLMATGGEIILLGTPRDEYNINLTDVLKPFHLANSALRLKPAHEWIYPVKQDQFVKHSFERNTKIVFELIKSGGLKIDTLLSHVIKPEAAAATYEALKNRDQKYLGVVIAWN